MQKFLIIVRFASIDHFCQFHRQLSSGHVFLPSARPLPEASRILLQLWIPEVETSFVFPGKVAPVSGNGKNSGMTVDVSMGIPHLLPGLNRALAAADAYKPHLDLAATGNLESVIEAHVIPEDDLLHLEMENEEDHVSKNFDLDPDSIPEVSLKKDDPLEFRLLADDEIPFHEPEQQISTKSKSVSSPPKRENHSGILFDDVKLMVNQVEFEHEIAKPSAFLSKKNPEKKDLTPEERAQAEPIGKFFMNLTKSMLRSGYYDPGHPSSGSAKKGLYDEFISVTDDCREIMVTHQSTREGTDMMLTGILDEPVSVRMLVGSGVAELFVPKLSSYCEKKKLLSFVIKREITPDHFYAFIDIMSDPKVDNQEEGKAGSFLTSTLVAQGITEISTIFVDDVLELEASLPWRVEMAINRLAKDLKILPLFQGLSSDAIKKMKLQTVKDIIRPLKHPVYLNDFLVNSYIIARYVESMPVEDIEEMIVAAFSIDQLLPTTEFTIKELDSLNRLGSEQPDNEQILRRLAGIRRILKLISHRVVVENIPGAMHFLQHLHRNNILNFEELPAIVQYFINSVKMADDVQANLSKYVEALDYLKDTEEALVYLQCFRRVVPVFVESDNWDAVSRIAAALKTACSRPPLSSDKVHSGLKVKRKDGVEDFTASSLFRSLSPADRPLAFVFKDISEAVISSYGESDTNLRRILDHIIDDLGSFGANMLSRMITESPDREVRKQSFEALLTKGVHARNWAVSALDDSVHPWFVHRNAMMILGKVSHEEGDFDCARKFLEHENPKIREEALNLIVSLRPADAENLIIRAFDDSDPKVRWRAVRSLENFNPISQSAIHMLLVMISMPMPKDKELAEQQISKTVSIISTINSMKSIPIHSKVESQILETVKAIVGEKKSLWKKVKSAVGSDQETVVLKAAIPLLGKIGSEASRTFLKQAAKAHPELSEIIKKAALQIK
ncbi:MAG: HEAT repeat domain-containing protein [Desulfobacteraceae bacterium]|nr:MAG: HEAT repeat domain-containing protein [Desulfobacteraceae bacterium]